LYTLWATTPYLNRRIYKMLPVKTLYETDFNLWLEETALLLREGRLDQLDIENILEEIEGMSRSEKDALESNLIRVLQHLLKWNYQPEKRSVSWSYTIIEHSRRLNKAVNYHTLTYACGRLTPTVQCGLPNSLGIASRTP
jgi:CRISPR/Cas system CMR subunit Cmr4 (Cas7 group RAMP superfamily)